MFGLEYLAPQHLWWLAAVAALTAIYVGTQLRRRQFAVRFTNTDLLGSVAPRRPGWRRHVTALVFLVGLAALVLAFARPAREEQVPKERATVVIAMDTSLSMEATDVGPTRFDAAKAAATRFVEEIPDSINVGLVSFDGVAVTRVAPTIDHQQVTDSIAALQLDESTAIGDAILESLAAIETVPPDDEGTPPPARIVLMSDGETTVGTPNEVATAAALEADVAISTIAFGTESGFIEDPAVGQVIPVPVKPDALQDIASSTDGSFFAAATGEELTSVYEDIGSSVGYESEFREVSTWFTGAALGLLLATASLSLLWFSRLP